MAFSKEELSRYSRHFVLPEIGVKGQKKLLSSSVLVIGAGALGSASLMYLAAAGVGRIGIADFDRVELSNLQRQIIHNTESVGDYKTESASRTLGAINPGAEV
ncbi:MAG: ThiF family adenylyltransferase, partial [Clostridia bacterium]|nr:ThiF family adenylyltransferase [Clostridia bacterium]